MIDFGVEDQIDVMRALALGITGRQSAVVRQAAEAATSGLKADEFAGAISAWVFARAFSQPDPCREAICTPERMIADGQFNADADEIATLIAAMCLAVGLQVEFVAVGFKQTAGNYAHVFTRAKSPQARAWVDTDPYACIFDVPGHATIFRAFPVEGS
jgi:hypothetical protein